MISFTRSLLGHLSDQKTNNLNLIRLVLALAVIYAHAYPLSLGAGRGVDLINRLTQGQATGGTVAVDLFFLISGFLITASWLHSSSMQNFLQRRVLRIYPAYVVAMVFSAALIWGICPAFRAMPEHQGAPYFLTLISWGIDFLKDCVMLTFNSISWKRVFDGNPYPGCANASLWTIQKEFFCYLLVAAFGIFALFRHRAVMLAAALLIYADYAWNEARGKEMLQLDCRYLCYFFIGMNFWLWRDKVPYSGKLAAGCLLILVSAVMVKPLLPIIMPFCGGYLVLWLGYAPKVPFLDWTHRTDLSYGTYLYAYPVQQLFAMIPSLRNPLVNVALTVPCVLVLAWLSWNLVEKRFLALKSWEPVDRDPALGKNPA
jgi:peptidoglycan/LPS O-acetylase OafA/YrhL